MNVENIIQSDILEFPLRYCSCGCGKIIRSVDSKGREVRYVVGHNRRKPRDTIKLEISKITDTEQLRDIIYNQAKIIHELQDRLRLQDCPTPEQYARHS